MGNAHVMITGNEDLLKSIEQVTKATLMRMNTTNVTRLVPLYSLHAYTKRNIVISSFNFTNKSIVCCI